MKNRDLKLSLEVLVMSLPVLLRALQPVLQPMLQSMPWPMTQTTGMSDPSRGLLKALGNWISSESTTDPSWGRSGSLAKAWAEASVVVQIEVLAGALVETS